MHNESLSNTGRGLLNRRAFLQHAGTGLSSIALAALLHQDRAHAASDFIRPVIDPKAPFAARPPHITPRAKRVLFVFCSGAVSHIDTFDHKPALYKYDGQPLPGGDNLITFQGEQGNVTKPLWDFKPRGQSGKYASDLLPNLANMVDDFCFIHSMTAKSNTHGPAECQMNTGFILDGFPSIGSWATYALGCEASDLPAYVAIPDPRGYPQVGPNSWTSGFLPAVFQGVSFNADKPIAHLQTPPNISPEADHATREFLKFMNEKHLEQFPGDTELSARIASYEMAAKLQLRAAEVGDFSTESESTRKMYCIDDANKTKAAFGRNCLLARRLLERGVRFVHLFNGAYAMGEGVGNWDGHRVLKEQYDIHGPILDEPCAALFKDIKARGLLDDTLVVWATEFGRMPTFQKGASGRDHNPQGFTSFMMGAGVKAPFSYGATDEFGYKAVENVTTIYDFHATILHLLGLNHEQLTFYHNGAERRLTDVHGHVIGEVIA
ncbi:MAG: DUF1501 domain-containing protein [Candidatus Hydrogenedentes bacterium]|nr:DUF1501 domain-containing protein [Candidatus Hydrogenedentota bacterium]